EQQWQDIQNFNKQVGAFAPPRTLASAMASSGGAGGDVNWRDPSVQGFIDDWLRGVQLTEWGQYLAPGAIAAGAPDHGSMQRPEWIWANLNAKTADSNITLGDYVRARLAGKSPQIVLNRHVTVFGPSIPGSSAGSSVPPASQ